MEKLVAITLLVFLLTLGGMALSQPPTGGMMGPQGGMMNMMGQCPMVGTMNMMNQCAAMMGGQQMGQMIDQCVAMMGGQPATPGSQPQEKSNK